MAINNVFIGIIVLCLFIALYFIWSFTYWKRRNINNLCVYSIFGNLTEIVFKTIPSYEITKKAYKNCKLNGDKYIGFYFITKPALVVTDPELIKRVLETDFDYFTDRTFYLNEVSDPLSVNLLGMKGTQWRSTRKMLSPFLELGNLKKGFHLLDGVADQLKITLDEAATNAETISVQDISSRFVVDVVATTVFEIECNTLRYKNHDLKMSAAMVLGGSEIQNLKMGFSVLCPDIMKFLRIPFYSREVKNFYKQLSRREVEAREKYSISKNDIIDCLIRGGKSKNLTIEEIAANIMIFFASSYETTSSVIAFCMYELICNEDVQDTLRKEVCDVLERYDGKITYEALMEMSYMEMCITETARKYPPAIGLTRTCTRDYPVPGENLTIEKGINVIVPVIDIHHDSTYFPHPEKFIPERFSKENTPSIFLAFGLGPRNCIGIDLAHLKVKLFLSVLLKNYKFAASAKVKLPMELHKRNIVLILKDELLVNISKFSGVYPKR